mmetsp:Transcript_5241/g.20819  ORF Transcript_5241/g.20819 Transcript_5241/m.20819 type:complete len:217 (-) Transcript_5241:504-1154(-)
MALNVRLGGPLRRRAAHFLSLVIWVLPDANVIHEHLRRQLRAEASWQATLAFPLGRGIAVEALARTGLAFRNLRKAPVLGNSHVEKNVRRLRGDLRPGVARVQIRAIHVEHHLIVNVPRQEASLLRVVDIWRTPLKTVVVKLFEMGLIQLRVPADGVRPVGILGCRKLLAEEVVIPVEVDVYATVWSMRNALVPFPGTRPVPGTGSLRGSAGGHLQ